MQTALDLVRNYIYYLEDCGRWLMGDYSFEKESYSKWAANELLIMLQNSPNRPPLETMEDFRNELARLASLNPATEDIFSYAEEAISDLIDELIG